MPNSNKMPKTGSEPTLFTPSDSVTTIFTRIAISYKPDLSPSVYSHEIIFEAAHAHHPELMFIRMPHALWDNPRENDIFGTTDPLTWENCPNPATCPKLKPAAFSYPDLVCLTGIDIINLPEIRSDNVQIIFGQLAANAPLTFTITSRSAATHILAKNLWLFDADNLQFSLTNVHPLSEEHDKHADAYANEVRDRHPTAHYWHCINFYYPAGVDYWILPIIKKSPAP